MSSRLLHPTRAAIPSYHSRTVYAVPPAQAEAIVRVTAYHRKDFDLAVVWFPPREHAKVAVSISSAFRDPTTTLGHLDRLPLELVNEICLRLDMASIFHFWQTNLRARQIVDSLHEYQIVATSALNCLCALLRTGSASRVILSNFYQRLCEQTCSVCGDRYGDLISLLTWTRCCSTCLRKRAPELRVATAATVRRILRLSKELVEKLPSLTTLPGVFSMDEKPRKARVKVVDAQSALSAYYKGNSGSGPMLDRISRPDLEFMVCCALPSYNPRTKRIQNGVSCAGCQVAVEDGIDPSGADWLFDFRDMVYSIDGFLKHFEWCEQAQHLWTSSTCGTIEPAKYPHSCRIGGYFNRRQ
ncbi:hypothetical protein B0J12DRAFT_450411 [Macrophomina phaseolina]|uniref:F-box domain-containing protein n=1 Tax=Macrophomina phaseolina TaxID=35725 RepID=A0ABQ8GFC1_9PEZI|nr:hypothetical protein B0J12DRAFT_450411 [Macrophomina phaseolina]